MLTTTTLLFTACNTAPKGATVDQLSEQSYPKIALIGNFPAKVVYGMPSEQSSMTQPLKVAVPVRLLADKFMAVKYRFIFLEANGMPIKPQMDWRERTLQPKINTYLEASALSTKAHDWKLEIKSADLTYKN
ncbi:DUF1425 domain-containing protein [Planctomycetota bacterium]|nr:DUF1425 domain-containing protein [Planctomycetota bacterium]